MVRKLSSKLQRVEDLRVVSSREQAGKALDPAWGSTPSLSAGVHAGSHFQLCRSRALRREGRGVL